MNKSEFKIRTMRSTDLAQMHAVRRVAFENIYASFRKMVGNPLAVVVFHETEDQQGAHLDAICRANSGHKVFVAVCGDKIIGFPYHSVGASA